MKSYQSIAVVALISTSSATKISTPDGHPVYPLEYHFNEDPHSVPDPLSGKRYMTATQAKYARNDDTDLSFENYSIHDDWHRQFNQAAREIKPKDLWMTKYWGKETLAVQTSDNNAEESDSSDSDSSDDEPENQNDVQTKWTVTADLGELDDHATMYREFDKDYSIGGAKTSGWTNPLSWTDNGHDDDVVLLQSTEQGIKQRRIREMRVPESNLLQYAEAEGPTKVDLGEDDNNQVLREADKNYMTGGTKFHGWSNPLSWADDGEDDAVILGTPVIDPSVNHFD